MTNLSQMSSPESSTSSNSAETTTTTTTLKRKNPSEDEERKEEAAEETTFVQAKSCLDLDREETDESFTLCRDCDDAQDDENEDSENEEEGRKESSKDCCCRFIGWRKLRMKEAEDEENAATPRCLEVVGFLSPQDALEDDVKLWSVEKNSCYDSVLSAETESEQAEAILGCVRQSFDAMIKYELEMRNKYMKESNLSL